MQGMADFFRWLADAHHINLTIFYDSVDQKRFLLGLYTTIWLSAVCIVMSILLGLVGAAMQGARSRIVRAGVQGFVQFFRNTPPLVQLAFFYFAVSTLLPTVSDGHGGRMPMINNTGWAVISFSLFAAAFNIEIFRSGIEAVPRSTVEAAEALGYSRTKAYVYVILPLAFRVCFPALGNNLVNLVKTTTLAYAIGVPELLYAAAQIWSEVLNVREMMWVLLITYIVILAALVFVLDRWERALRIPGYSA
ncbi:MAG: amino acid ABC transporter permease [Pseudolabrys sp.]|nr:amino acid ABC transporter permease [Pseudolabrys sp.]